MKRILFFFFFKIETRSHALHRRSQPDEQKRIRQPDAGLLSGTPALAGKITRPVGLANSRTPACSSPVSPTGPTAQCVFCPQTISAAASYLGSPRLTSHPTSPRRLKAHLDPPVTSLLPSSSFPDASPVWPCSRRTDPWKYSNTHFLSSGGLRECLLDLLGFSERASLSTVLPYSPSHS